MKRLLSPYLLLALNCPAMILTLTLTLTLILTVTLIYLMRIFADKGLTSMQYVKLAVWNSCLLCRDCIHSCVSF